MTNYFGNGKDDEFKFDSIANNVNMEDLVKNLSYHSKKKDIINTLKIYFKQDNNKTLDFYELCANRILEIFGEKEFVDLTPRY